jgi:hypothetical protein
MFELPKRIMKRREYVIFLTGGEIPLVPISKLPKHHGKWSYQAKEMIF